jgi:hypothetical protein
MIWRAALLAFGFTILVAACAPRPTSSAATPAQSSVVEGDGYKVTKQPIKGDITPIYPDGSDPNSKEPPKQKSYDTPYQPGASKRPVTKGEMKPIEPAPAPPKGNPVSPK